MAKKKEIDRINISDSIDVDIYKFEESIEKTIDYLNSIRDEAINKGMAGEGHLLFWIEECFGDSYVRMNYNFIRSETDSEYEKRIELINKHKEREKQEKEKKKEKDYELYLKLKKRFESKGN